MTTNEIYEITRNITQELFDQGYTPEEALRILSAGVVTLTTFVHPAGFDMPGKQYNLAVSCVLADWVPTEKH